MNELRAVLLAHAEMYPLMEPTDAVKLLYQNEFGGGHMIRDEAACLAYLRWEYEATPRNFDKPLTESIGNGIVRVQLAALPPEDLDALGQAFIRSAANHKGTLEGFLSKLELLRHMTDGGVFAFDSAALESYLAQYAADGYPPVSHSAAYRNAYHPAYRIIKENAEGRP